MTVLRLLFFGLMFILSPEVFSQDEKTKDVLLKATKGARELVETYKQSGGKVVVIAIPEEDLKQFFPDDPTKRQKVEAKVLIADEESVFKAKISPGGQSTLKSKVPNLRVKKLKNLTGEADTLVGVNNISGTTRINPLTMDEGYISTKFYQRALNRFELVPETFQLDSKFTRVLYVPLDAKGALLESKRINAGIHLVNHHPVKFLAEAQTENTAVEAIGRSRYNVVNLQERLRLIRPDPETEIFSSLNSSQKTAPHRVELSWAMDDAKKVELKKLLENVYSAPLRFSGEELFKELSKSMDVDQMFRFLAFNHIVRNGDISDEYFWFTQKDKKTGKTFLRIMPQDGDDLLKGAHMFPFNKDQIGLIARDKLKRPTGFIFNFEDPLFRTFRKDPYLYHEYLKTYQKVAKDLMTTSFLDDELKAIERELNTFIDDPEVLKRGSLDEIAKPYEKDSFSRRAQTIKDSIKKNANEALLKLEHGKLDEVHKLMLAQRNKSLKFKCSNALRLMMK